GPAVGLVPPRLDQPPSDLPAPLAGTLVDGSADLQDAIATLVDLADRGVLTLHEADNDVRVTLHRPVDDSALRPYERVLLQAVFEPRATQGDVMLSTARARFASAVPALEASLHAAVADQAGSSRIQNVSGAPP